MDCLGSESVKRSGLHGPWLTSQSTDSDFPNHHNFRNRYRQLLWPTPQARFGMNSKFGGLEWAEGGEGEGVEGGHNLPNGIGHTPRGPHSSRSIRVSHITTPFETVPTSVCGPHHRHMLERFLNLGYVLVIRAGHVEWATQPVARIPFGRFRFPNSRHLSNSHRNASVANATDAWWNDFEIRWVVGDQNLPHGMGYTARGSHSNRQKRKKRRSG